VLWGVRIETATSPEAVANGLRVDPSWQEPKSFTSYDGPDTSFLLSMTAGVRVEAALDGWRRIETSAKHGGDACHIPDRQDLVDGSAKGARAVAAPARPRYTSTTRFQAHYGQQQ